MVFNTNIFSTLLDSFMSKRKAERDQLRCNLTEANDRADLLAQEVDDHHAQLEKTSKEELT